jgi:Xaa-Pro aminopeptidase
MLIILWKVFFAYAIVTLSNAILFVNASQVSGAVRQHLGSEVTIKPYEDIWSALEELGNGVKEAESVYFLNFLPYDHQSRLIFEQVLLSKGSSLAVATSVGEVGGVLVES